MGLGGSLFKMREGFEVLKIKVRTAVQEDASKLTTLCLQLGYPVTCANVEKRIAVLESLDGESLLVAEDENEKILGWIQLSRGYSLVGGEQAEISGLVVDETIRRSGIGRTLVEAAQDWARAGGFSKLRVKSNAARDVAHSFYPSLGFKKEKTQHCYGIVV